MAKITLIGMNNWDESLFDYLIVPEGIDKETLVNNILITSGDFEVLYSDFDFLKFSIGVWSKKYAPTFEKWVRALSVEYNPLENYNRIEEWSDSESGTQSGSNSGSKYDTISQQSSETSSESLTGSKNGSSSGSTSGNTGSTTTNKVSAYDSGNTLTTKDQAEIHGNDSSQSSTTIGEQSSETRQGTNSGSLSGTNSETSSNESSEAFSKEATRSGNVHGNIGVMSSQNMLQQELDIAYWNIYEKITDLFLADFVIPVY